VPWIRYKTNFDREVADVSTAYSEREGGVDALGNVS
jgi:hypothetical protein